MRAAIVTLAAAAAAAAAAAVTTGVAMLTRGGSRAAGVRARPLAMPAGRERAPPITVYRSGGKTSAGGPTAATSRRRQPAEMTRFPSPVVAVFRHVARPQPSMTDAVAVMEDTVAVMEDVLLHRAASCHRRAVVDSTTFPRQHAMRETDVTAALTGRRLRARVGASEMIAAGWRWELTTEAAIGTGVAPARIDRGRAVTGTATAGVTEVAVVRRRWRRQQ